jgi:MFS family permease
MDWSGIVQGLLSRTAFWLLLVLNILSSITGWVVIGWLPAFLKEHFDLNLGEAGLSATVYVQVASLVGVLVGGMASDAWSRDGRRPRSFLPALVFLAAGPCLFLAVTTRCFPIALIGLVVFGLARGCYDANLMPILRETADERLSATGYGLFNFTGTATGGIMVLVGGWLSDRGVGLQPLFQVCAVGLVGVGLLLLAVRQRPAADSVLP